MKQIPTIYCPYGNILNFSCTSRIHFSRTIRHCAHSNQWDWVWTDTQTETEKWKHNMRQFHSVHLADTRHIKSIWVSCSNAAGEPAKSRGTRKTNIRPNWVNAVQISSVISDYATSAWCSVEFVCKKTTLNVQYIIGLPQSKQELLCIA